MRRMSEGELVAYCNQYGFIFQGSQIYGGLANTWDYGPLGARLKNSLKDAWRRYFIQCRDDSYELDADILMNPAVWEASGHLKSFADPLVDCRACKTRHRADNLLSAFDPSLHPDMMTNDEMNEMLRECGVPCPNCGKHDFTPIRQFNLMFETHRGVTNEGGQTLYLRPENAQGEYVNFHNVLRTMRTKLPFGIGQIGKVFRNEITPGNFIFRTIEFEQMEYQLFCRPGEDEAWYDHFKQTGLGFYAYLGIAKDRLRFHDHEKLAYYAKAATDIEYDFPFGWGEINGTHNRTDFDLKSHQEYSGKSMEYFDEETRERFLPYVVESTYGVGRTLLALLSDALVEEELPGGDTRLVLRIKPSLAPVQACILPLVKKRHADMARKIQATLRTDIMTSYDDAGNIGKRYRRADAIGTPYAITIDDETIERGTVTIRERDTMMQETIAVAELPAYLAEALRRDRAIG